jgi:hypothetical protein
VKKDSPRSYERGLSRWAVSYGMEEIRGCGLECPSRVMMTLTESGMLSKGRAVPTYVQRVNGSSESCKRSDFISINY